jgi:hypothetical protein
MTKISMGINEQEEEKEDTSEDVDDWDYETSLSPSLFFKKMV